MGCVRMHDGLRSDGALKPRSELRLGVVSPMANEGSEAQRFTKAVLAQCTGFRDVVFFAVFDLVSRDNSLDLMKELAAEDPRVNVVWAPENRCIVDAYIRGYKEALAGGCDWILEIDAGFSHQPEDVPRFFTEMESGLDCVFGSRFMSGGEIASSSLMRRLVSWGGTKLTNILLGTTQSDMTSGFELFSRTALERVLERGIRSRAHFFQTEIKFHCRDLRFVEVPIKYRSASPGLGMSSIREALGNLLHLWNTRHKGSN